MNKSKETLVKKLGGVAAYKEHMKNIRGMVKDHPRAGAFNDPEFAAKAGAKGGKASKRGKAKKDGL